MGTWGSSEVESVRDLCQQVVDLMTRIDEEELIDVLNGDNEVATGAMYARALVMDLIDLGADGEPYVRAAHAALRDMVDLSNDDEDAS